MYLIKIKIETKKTLPFLVNNSHLFLPNTFCDFLIIRYGGRFG